MYSLRTRLGILAAAMLVLAVILQVVAIQAARSSYAGDGTLEPPSFSLTTVLSTMATFSISVAGVFVAGIVATYVVDHYLAAQGAGTAAAGDDSSSGDDVAAYGSDPETL
jgi:hypothetical protein